MSVLEVWGSQVQVATTGRIGVVKPDGETVTVDPDGTIHSAGGGGQITYLQFDGGNATSVYSMGTMQYDMGASA